MEQIKAMDEARRRLNDWCIKSIKEDIERRKSQMVTSFFHVPHPESTAADIGIMVFLNQWGVFLVAAELSMEISRDLMQEMLTQRFWGEEVGFECMVNGPATVVFGSKKFSKYFRFCATLSQNPRKEQ